MWLAVTFGLLRLYSRNIACGNRCPLAVNISLDSKDVLLSGLDIREVDAGFFCLSDEFQFSVNKLEYLVLLCAGDFIPLDGDTALVCGQLYIGFVIDLC